MSAIAERVAAGAAFLDEHEPGWDQRINLNRLYIGASCDCILGQLHGNYARGLRATDLFNTDGNAEAALGFMWVSTGKARQHEVADLTAEWKRLIKARRAS